MRFGARSRHHLAGFTLAEAVISVAVSMIGLGGVMMMNAQQLKLVSSIRESNAASWVLQDRVEQMRHISWDHLTNADLLKSALSNVPECASALQGYKERITLVKSSDATKADATKLVIERTGAGQATTISAGAGISTGVEVKADVLISWTGKGGRVRQRSYTSIISDSGITRTNVPGFGGPTGATPVDRDGETDPTTPGDDSTPDDPTQPDETPTTTPGNSGNGNGNGNGIGNGNGSNGNPHGNTNQNPGRN
jgi:Tfp pilus assembly protein PilV